MSIRSNVVTTGLAALGLFLSTGPAFASDFDSRELDQEIQSCIAEVGQRVNYDNATHVRHEVVEVERAELGHALTIGTLVFSGSGDIATREYAAYCVAYRDNKPRRFRISEASRGA